MSGEDKTICIVVAVLAVTFTLLTFRIASCVEVVESIPGHTMQAKEAEKP